MFRLTAYLAKRQIHQARLRSRILSIEQRVSISIRKWKGDSSFGDLNQTLPVIQILIQELLFHQPAQHAVYLQSYNVHYPSPTPETLAITRSPKAEQNLALEQSIGKSRPPLQDPPHQDLPPCPRVLPRQEPNSSLALEVCHVKCRVPRPVAHLQPSQCRMCRNFGHKIQGRPGRAVDH